MEPSNQKEPVDLLFWSGGKDSFLALQFYRDETGRDPLLLTTYNDEDGTVPHQNIPVEVTRRQALQLELIIFTVPISHPASNERYLKTMGRALESIPFQINELLFGDLHLRDIRQWREEQFSELGYKSAFPIWEKSADELISRLEAEPVDVRVSGVNPAFREFIEPGVMFDREFIQNLPSHIDPMGERGEFHTEVQFRPDR